VIKSSIFADLVLWQGYSTSRQRQKIKMIFHFCLYLLVTNLAKALGLQESCFFMYSVDRKNVTTL